MGTLHFPHDFPVLWSTLHTNTSPLVFWATESIRAGATHSSYTRSWNISAIHSFETGKHSTAILILVTKSSYESYIREGEDLNSMQ